MFQYSFSPSELHLKVLLQPSCNLLFIEKNNAKFNNYFSTALKIGELQICIPPLSNDSKSELSVHNLGMLLHSHMQPKQINKQGFNNMFDTNKPNLITFPNVSSLNSSLSAVTHLICNRRFF
jgi:type IV secretory pathway TrbL component